MLFSSILETLECICKLHVNLSINEQRPTEVKMFRLGPYRYFIRQDKATSGILRNYFHYWLLADFQPHNHGKQSCRTGLWVKSLPQVHSSNSSSKQVWNTLSHLCVVCTHGPVAEQGTAGIAEAGVGEHIVIDLIIPRFDQLQYWLVPVVTESTADARTLTIGMKTKGKPLCRYVMD